jgi:hypothetical protein
MTFERRARPESSRSHDAASNGQADRVRCWRLVVTFCRDLQVENRPISG